MKFWLLTDTHFGHDMLVKENFRPSGFEDKILTNVERMISPEDLLIDLGDFCFYRNVYWHERFNEICKCRKWRVRGNHDKKSYSWYLDHGWDFCAESIRMNIFGKEILLSHRPLPENQLEGVDLNIHGHHHDIPHHPEDTTCDKHRLIYIEHKYEPVLLRTIVEKR